MAYFINVKKNNKKVEINLNQKPFVNIHLNIPNDFTTICVN
jgi:hypothetical protein